VFTNPFPQWQQLLTDVNANTRAPTKGNQEGEYASNVYMVKSHVNISIRAHDYGETEPSKAKNAYDTQEPLHIEMFTVEPIPQMSKGSSK